MKKIQLFRIDDRLIHGQVVLGWANPLKSEMIFVCDDSVFENEWERELYLSCAPEDITVKICNEDETAKLLNSEDEDFKKAIVLVNNPAVVESLLNKNVQLETINVGGIHYKEGRRNFLPYLYLNQEEISCFKKCMEKGIYFYCQDVPTGKKINLKDII